MSSTSSTTRKGCRCEGGRTECGEERIVRGSWNRVKKASDGRTPCRVRGGTAGSHWTFAITDAEVLMGPLEAWIPDSDG